MKNPALKKKKNWRNLLMYIATYIVVTFSVAFVVVSFSNKTFSSNASILKPQDSSTLGMVVTKLMETEDAKIKLTASAKSGDTTVELEANVSLMIYSGFSGVDVKVDTKVIVNDVVTNAVVIYKDNVAYVSIGDQHYSMKASNIVSAGMGVLNLCGVDLDLSGDIMSSFDMSMMDSIGDLITEEKTDNGITLTFTATDDVKLDINVDKDYNILNVKLQKTKLQGIDLDANIDFVETNTKTTVSVDNLVDYTDLSESFGVMETIFNTVKGGKMSLGFNEYGVDMLASLDLTNGFAGKVNVKALEKDFSLTYINNYIYLDTNIIKLKAQLPKLDIAKLKDFEANSININENQIEQLKDTAKTFAQSLKTFKLTTVEKTDFGYSTIVGGVELKFVVNSDNILKEIQVVENGKTHIVYISNTADIQVADDTYTLVNDFEFLVEPIKQIINEKHIESNIEIAYNGTISKGTLVADFNGDPYMQINTEFGGLSIAVTLNESGVFVKAGDVKVKLNYNNIIDVVNSLDINSDTNNFVKELLNYTVKFTNVNNQKLVASYNQTTISAVADNGMLKCVEVKLGDINITLTKTTGVKIENNFDDFEEIVITSQDVEKVLDLINTKTYSLSGSVKVKDNTIDYNIALDFTKGINNVLAQAQVNVFGKTLKVNVQDGNVYVKFDTIKIGGSFEEISDIINNVMSLVGDTKLDSNITLNLQKQDSKIVATLNVGDVNVKAIIDFTDFSVKVKVNDVDADLNLSKGGVVTKLTDSEIKYYTLNMENIYSVVNSLINTASAKNIKAVVNLNVDDKAYVVNAYYVNNGSATVKFETTIEGIKVWGYLLDGKVYVNVFDICFMLDLNNMEKHLDQISEVFGINLNASKDLVKVVNCLDLSKLQNLEITKNLLDITISDINVRVSTYNDLISRIRINYNNISGNVAIYYPEQQEFNIVNNRIIELDDVVKVGNAFYNTFKNKSISGDIDLNFKLFNEFNTINIKYGVKFDGEISGYINTTFKGLDVNIYYVNKTFYLDVIGLKLKLAFDDIPSMLNWINCKFNTNFNVDALFDDFDISTISLDFLTSVVFSDGTVNARLFDKVDLVAEYTNSFNRVKFNAGSISGTLYVTDFDNFTLNNVVDSDYANYTSLTNIVDAVYGTISERQFDITANTNVFRNNAKYYDVDLSLVLNIIEQLDTTNLEASGVARVSGEKKVKLDLGYFDHKLYANYDGLKVSIHKDNIKEILGIVLTVLNVDTSNIPVLNNLKQEFDIDTDNLSQIVPTLSNINPLNYLEYIKNIGVNDNAIEITLNGARLNGDPHFNPIVRLEMAGGKLANVRINKLYTGVTADENITINITLNEYKGITKVVDSEYIDISNSSDIIRAFVNTSSMNDYHINGNVIMNLKLGSLEINAAKLDVDVKVKLDKNKKPIIAVEIGKYPLIGLVNNSNTNGVGDTGLGFISQRYRSISIYYANGEIYLQTSDEKWGAYKQLDRVTKVTPKYLVDNINYYMQWLLGFTDTIQSKINEAIETSKTNKANAINDGSYDYSNVILNYVKNGNTHSFDVNIGKLAYNNDLGKLHIDLSTVNNASTGNKDYLGTINFNLDLLNSIIILKTDNDSNLKLTDIGSSADVSKALVALSNSRFQLDGEYEKTGTGNWQMANQGERTVILYDGETQVGSLTGLIGTAIALPSYPNKTVDNGTSEKVYEFLGWFTSDGTKYTSTAYPRYDTVLYAKWNLISDRAYHTIKFETNENVSAESITRLTGEQVNLPVLKNIEMELDETTSILKVFKGWYLDETFTTLYNLDTMPNKDVSLYAKWETVETKTYHVSIYSAGIEVYNAKVQAGVSFEFPVSNYFKEDTLYYLDETFTIKVTDFVINSDTTWYAKNKYKYTIYSKYTTLNGGEYNNVESVYEGSTITLPTYTNYEINNISYTTEYHFMGWSKDGGETLIKGNTVVDAGDSSYTAVWEVKDYCIVTFNVSAWVKPDWWKPSKLLKDKQVSLGNVSNTNNTNKVKIEKGTKLVFSNFVAETTHSYGPKYNFVTAGWTEGDVQNIYDGSYAIDSLEIGSHITLNPVWKHK